MTYVDRGEVHRPGQPDRRGARTPRREQPAHRGRARGRRVRDGVFRFSELTLVVAQQRVLKHVGSYTWDGDFEVYDYDDVTGLHFEDGSVATAVVIEAAGRPERIKAPNEQAGVVRRTIQEALFDYYEVDSLDALNRKIAVETEDPNADESDDHSSGLGLDSGIDPLVSDSDDSEAAEPEPKPEPGAATGIHHRCCLGVDWGTRRLGRTVRPGGCFDRRPGVGRRRSERRCGVYGREQRRPRSSYRPARGPDDRGRTAEQAPQAATADRQAKAIEELRRGR